MSLKDTLIALVIIFIWGFNFIIIAWGIESMPPLLMGGLRFVFVAVLGCLFVRKPNIPWRWMALYTHDTSRCSFRAIKRQQIQGAFF